MGPLDKRADKPLQILTFETSPYPQLWSSEHYVEEVEYLERLLTYDILINELDREMYRELHWISRKQYGPYSSNKFN